MIDYNRKLIEKFKRRDNLACVQTSPPRTGYDNYAFFIIDCRGKIKNLLVTNKSVKINKNVRLISWCELSCFVAS